MPVAPWCPFLPIVHFKLLGFFLCWWCLTYIPHTTPSPLTNEKGIKGEGRGREEGGKKCFALPLPQEANYRREGITGPAAPAALPLPSFVIEMYKFAYEIPSAMSTWVRGKGEEGKGSGRGTGGALEAHIFFRGSGWIAFLYPFPGNSLNILG